MADNDGGDEGGARFVPLEVDPIAALVFVHGVPFLVIDLNAGCECHPDETLLVQRRHCLN